MTQPSNHKHPFLGKNVVLTKTEQEAVNLESKYERMIHVWNTEWVGKAGASLGIRTVHEQLNDLWKQVRQEALAKRKEEVLNEQR